MNMAAKEAIEAEAIREIERLVVAANSSEILDVKGERKGVYFIVGPKGDAVKHVADPSWHSEQLETPRELLKFIASNKTDKSAVFIADEEVIFVSSLADRRDVAFCKLIEAEPYKWLKASSGNRLSQSDFIRVLRITFRECLGVDNGLIPLLRKLNFAASDGAAAEIQHGRESVARSINASIMGVNAIPEELVLRVPVFENHPFIAPVNCAIEIFPDERMFKLTPFPLQVRKAMQAALDDVENGLEGDELPPVYRGKP
jgi:hypothetical protein